MFLQWWLSLPATRCTPTLASASTVRADGHLHFSFTSTSAPARAARRAQVIQQRERDLFFVKPNLVRYLYWTSQSAW